MSMISFYLLQRALNESNKKSFDGNNALILPIVVGGALSITAITGVGIAACISDKQKEENQTKMIQELDGPTKIFEPGEHIISVPIDSPLEKPQQYIYHAGYKPIGITATMYGKANAHDGGSSILYVNETEVEAKPNNIIDEEYQYTMFGEPTKYEEIHYVEGINTFDFPAGTHILSIPVDDPTDNKNVEYIFHEGYEPVGLASASYGEANEHDGGACILFVNAEDVTVEKNEENKYTEFGKVKEEQKVKVKN